MKHATAACAAGVVALTVALGGSSALQSPANSRAECRSLRGLAVPASAIRLPTTGASVASANLIAAAPEIVDVDRTVLALPEYCQVTGSIRPVDPAAPPINFHINLPTRWNRKIAQLGGSGNNGVIPVALTTGMQWGPESIPPNAPYALSRGFVTYGSDSGHQVAGRGATDQPPPDWTTNDEAVFNFAYGQMKKTHDVVVALVARFYEEPIRRSYFLGSSQGGREALMVAQRFPQDYDGIFAQVPINAYVHGSIGEPLARAKAQAGDGWIPPSKVPLIAKEVLRQCDGLDGIADGLVSNYMACNRLFDPATTRNPLAPIRCANGADTGDSCLSDAQMRAADAVHASVSYPAPLGTGWTSFPGWPTGSESAANWKTLQARPTRDTANVGMLRSRIVRDPNVNLLDVDLARYAKELQQFSALIDATNPDLSVFQKRGGKLILKTNTTDYTVNPRAVMAYYDRVVQTMGARMVDQFMRFYVAVGLFHNRNVGRNPITNELVPMYVDFISMLDDWVEQGKVPADTQVLNDMNQLPPFTVNATFPMCRYPMYPRYTGKGDAKKAESYVCVN
jgi:feruloyl esterase